MGGKRKKRKTPAKKTKNKPTSDIKSKQTPQNNTIKNNKENNVINPSIPPNIESVSTFTDRLPFASPTLQLLQQEKLLGIKAHQNKLWKEAEKHFSHALELAAESYQEQLPSLYSSLGLVYFYLKDYNKAIEFCNSSIKFSAQHWPAYLCRSFANSCLKKLPMAASDYDNAATLLQNSSIPEKKLNRILQRAQDAALDSGVVRQKDKRIEVLNELGKLYFTAKTDVYPKDQSIFEEMPSLIPVGEPLGSYIWSSNPDDLTENEANEKAMKAKQKGNEAFNSKDWMAALLHYSRAIRLNPKACVYLKLHRYHETISDCTASIKREPNIKAYARRGAARAALSENQLACEDYLQALIFEPQNQSCLQELARCLCNIESEIVDKIGKIESKKIDGDLHQLKKQLMLVRKDITNVGSRLKEPVKEKKVDIRTRKSFEQKIINATKILKVDKCNSVAYLERALAYQALGDFENAEKDYREGLRVDPDNKELQKRLKFVIHISKK